MVALSFQPWKAAKVEQGCTQTIRKQRKRAFRVGDRLQLYQQQRSKEHSRKLFDFDPVCSEVKNVIFRWNFKVGGIQIHINDGEAISEAERLALALADGFDDVEGFDRFFLDTHLCKNPHFQGQIITWVSTYAKLITNSSPNPASIFSTSATRVSQLSYAELSSH